MTAFRSVVSVLDFCEFEEFPEAPLITFDCALRVTIATPKEVPRIV
jgi:hypothetical protein